MAVANTKQSYTIPCSSGFRDRVVALAHKKNANVADLVRSVILMVAPEHLAAFPDPGDPRKGDRETVVVKSGPAKGRPWRRKPRLQVRLAAGYEAPVLRRALGLALALDQNQVVLSLQGLDAAETAAQSPPWTPDQEDRRNTLHGPDDEEMARLHAIVSVLSFEPLKGGVKTPEQALHVLGLPPGSKPGLGLLKARFRLLAAIHHPDSGYGNHERMSQLNGAMDILGRDQDLFR